MFSRLFKTPKSSLQLFRKNQAAMLPNDAESPQVPSETFSSLPIIRKVGLKTTTARSANYQKFLNPSDNLPCFHTHLQPTSQILVEIFELPHAVFSLYT